MSKSKTLEERIQWEVWTALGAICNHPDLRQLDFTVPTIMDSLAAIEAAHAALGRTLTTYALLVQANVLKLERRGVSAVKKGDLHLAIRIAHTIETCAPGRKKPLERLKEQIMKAQTALTVLDPIKVEIASTVTVYEDGRLPYEVVEQLFPLDSDRKVIDLLREAVIAELELDYPNALDCLMQAELLDPNHTGTKGALGRVRKVMGNSCYGEPSEIVATA